MLTRSSQQVGVFLLSYGQNLNNETREEWIINERDYTLLQYMSLLAGLILIFTWIAFTAIYNINFTYRDIIFLLIIGIMSFGVSFVAYFKKQIYLAEMRNNINTDHKKGSD